MNLSSGAPGHPVSLGPGRAWSLASRCPQLTAAGPGPGCSKYTIRAVPLLPGAQQSLERTAWRKGACWHLVLASQAGSPGSPHPFPWIHSRWGRPSVLSESWLTPPFPVDPFLVGTPPQCSQSWDSSPPPPRPGPPVPDCATSLLPVPRSSSGAAGTICQNASLPPTAPVPPLCSRCGLWAPCSLGPFPVWCCLGGEDP